MNKYWETPNELSDRIGVSVTVIRKMIKNNELEHIRPTPSGKHVKIPIGSWEKCFAATPPSLTPRYQEPEASYSASAKSSVGLRLRNLRAVLALSQEDFSQSIACSRSAYQHYERGERDIPASIVAQVAAVHRVDLYWLLLDDDSGGPSNKGAKQ